MGRLSEPDLEELREETVEQTGRRQKKALLSVTHSTDTLMNETKQLTTPPRQKRVPLAEPDLVEEFQNETVERMAHLERMPPPAPHFNDFSHVKMGREMAPLNELQQACLSALLASEEQEELLSEEEEDASSLESNTQNDPEETCCVVKEDALLAVELEGRGKCGTTKIADEQDRLVAGGDRTIGKCNGVISSLVHTQEERLTNDSMAAYSSGRSCIDNTRNDNIDPVIEEIHSDSESTCGKEERVCEEITGRLCANVDGEDDAVQDRCFEVEPATAPMNLSVPTSVAATPLPSKTVALSPGVLAMDETPPVKSAPFVGSDGSMPLECTPCVGTPACRHAVYSPLFLTTEVQVRRPRTRRSLLGLMPATTGQHHIGMMQTGRLPTMEEDEVEIVGFKEAEPESDAVVYKVFYTKQRKKHKTFESGVLVVYRMRTLLFTDEGKQVTVFTTKKTWKTVGEGESLGWVRDFLIEVDNEVPYTDYMSGRVFLGILHAQACTKDNSDAQEPPRKRARTSITGLSSTTAPVPARSAAAAAVPPRLSKCPPEISNVLVLEPPDVYLDAFLASKLQKHQVQGVKFLYRAFRRPSGAILADGMGLGKSLQALSFLWVILSKKIQGRPLAKKAAIVCPSSLCDAWVLEIRKWMGEARMKPTLVQAMNPEQTIQNFCAGKSTVNDHILIISYDFLRRYAKLLTHIDVLVCDEGHRMSHESTCASKALRKIGKVRIVLSGTPLQNNLDELFSLCDFVCPHIIADWNVFKKAILKSRDPNATEEEKRLGEARARQLDEVTKPFLLRRTTDILNLPPKNVFLVFLPFTDAQEYLSVLNDGFANPLGTLQKLRRICFLSKIQVLRNFLKSMWEEMPQENIVLVSSFTTCLDAIGKMLKELEAPYIRLDGSTATKDRQLIVDRWNSSSKTGRLVFLLSSRAGGVGLNLQQGGRRMVIVDPDWNPANDLQVMGRLWRMGQKKEVFIYRLCMAGSVEEKILQRQEMKVDLAALAVDGKSETSLDNWDDLRQLFHLEGIVGNRTVTLSPFVRARVEKLRAVANAVLVPWGPYVGTAEDAAESSATENSLTSVHMHGQDPGSAPQKSGEQLGAEGPSVPPQYAVSAHVEPASLNVPVIPPQASEPSSALQGPNILPHNSSFAHLELVVLDEPDTPPLAPDPWTAPQGPCVPPQDPSSALRGPAQLDALMIPPHGLDIWSLPQWLNAAGTPMILPQPVYGENNAQELMVQPLTGPQKPTEVPKRSICLIAADDPEAKRAKLDDGGDVTSREGGKSLMGCPWREENEHPLPVSGAQLREEEDSAKKGDDSITRNDAPQVGGISVTPYESRIYYS
eukprot:GEMP01000931.1.p1 GENE.GEMP01000931.1~~GEMP01000931.1.p1  ORF type:complete len:1486 (+),score=346.66 GEMP01000931.1:465-4460(+)